MTTIGDVIDKLLELGDRDTIVGCAGKTPLDMRSVWFQVHEDACRIEGWDGDRYRVHPGDRDIVLERIKIVEIF